MAEALEQYKKNFTVNELIEQIPVNKTYDKQRLSKQADVLTDYGSDEGDEVDEDDRLKKPARLEDIFEHKNSRVCQQIQFEKTEEDTASERELRAKTAAELQLKLDSLLAEKERKLKKNGEISEKLKARLRKVEKNLEIINSDVMTEKVFNKKDEELDEDELQSNRPVYKEGLLDDKLTPPYQRFPLFIKSKNTEKLSLYRVGEPTGAILKATVNIKIVDPNEPEMPEVDSIDFDFNFFHPLFKGEPLLITKFVTMPIVVRVYLLRALSLCAVDDASDLPAIAAGLEALSIASSYPELQVGEKQEM